MAEPTPMEVAHEWLEEAAFDLCYLDARWNIHDAIAEGNEDAAQYWRNVLRALLDIEGKSGI